MNQHVVVKKSKIDKKGVFAERNFKKGEIVLEWHPKVLKKSEMDELSNKEKHFVEKIGKKYFLILSPERFVNHSCDPNTKVKNKCDAAIRDIKKGEEITSNYKNSLVYFKCRCESKNCRGNIN